MRRATFGADPGKMTFPEFRDILHTASAFRLWDLGKGDLPTLSDESANSNADLQAMADRTPPRTVPPKPPPTPFK